MDTVGFCWITLFADVAVPVIPRAGHLSIRVIEQNLTSERRRSSYTHDAPANMHKKAGPVSDRPCF